MKKKTVTQFNIFGEPEVQVVKKNRPKKTEAHKKAEKEEREAKKKAEQDKEFERKWAERGVFQGNLFPTDECIRKTVSKVIVNYL